METIIFIICGVDSPFGVEQDHNIGPATGSANVFVLFSDNICPFILHHKQEGITLKILNLELESAFTIGFGLSLYWAAYSNDGVNRRGDISVSRNKS